MSTQHNGNGSVANDQALEVLVSGASFAGLATAWWMNSLGYSVTVVEVAKGLRKGGTPVNIEGNVIDVVRRMGLLERVASLDLPKRPLEFLDVDGVPVARIAARVKDLASTEEYEIERDTLLDMLFEQVKDRVEFLFDDSISTVEESDEEIAVTFASGTQRSFSLLFGCDGTHSAVRRMCFGEESSFLVFLQHYFSLTIVDRLLIEENTTQIFNVPGKSVMLSSYNKKTDIAFCFFSEQEVAYDRRSRDQQKGMVVQHFDGEGWRSRELLSEMNRCDDFYFDKLCQIRMPTWTKGRVALVGDAGYCPSPAAGLGGAMAILGAGALADAFKKYPNDFRRAFQEYDEALRPTVEEIQTQAVEVGLEMFAPKTEEGIRQRNSQVNAS